MKQRKKIANLSKSKFVAGLQCLKRLYLLCYEDQLVGEPDEATQARFDQGAEVGELARKAFEGGALVDKPYWEVQGVVEQTQRLVADKSVPAIFEGAFEHDNVIVRPDVLRREPGGKWDLIEVKSGTEVKEVHIPDVAIQKHVLRSCGLKLRRCFLMHLDRSYVYDGGEYDLQRLFHLAEVSREVANFEQELKGCLAAQQKTLRLTRAPSVEPGPQCTDPYECEFHDLCNQQLPENHISTLYRLRQERLEELEAMGVETLDQIPDGFPLSKTQERMVDCVKSGKPYVDPLVKEQLAALEYPLYFMDFETCNPALPRFPGMRPYDPFPFQWSVHVQKSPGAKPQHYEFLSTDGSDPREPFTAELLSVLSKHGKDGNIVVYSRPFEDSRLRELTEWLPQHGSAIEEVRGRLWDLLSLVRKHVYHPGFQGSFSIKNVLPALVPEMTYDGMDVADGTEAGLAYESIVRGELTAMEKQWLQKSLREYCRLDTLAMVEILDRLRRTGRSQ